METRGECFICLSKCDTLCPSCPNEIFYCSPEHESLHRFSNSECFPFKVVRKDGIGRCLVATRRINAGDLIFIEKPISSGNLHESSSLCLTCWKKLDDVNSYICSRCKIPMCSETCSNTLVHKENECDIFATLLKEEPEFKTPNIEPGSDIEHPFYQCIAPLRCLLIKEKSPIEWKAIRAMMDHVDDRPKDIHWEVNQKNIVQYLLQSCKLSMRFSAEEINHVIGVLEVNAFEVVNECGGKGRGVFPLTALMSHCCISNARYIINPDQSSQCRANVLIEVGEEITDYYVSPLHGTSFRRNHLRDGWFFHCQCDRCKDPTEFGTFLTSMRCTECPGQTLPQEPLQFDSAHKCQDCDKTYSAHYVSIIEDKVTSMIEMCDNTDREALEKLLDLALQKLVPNHYLVLCIKRHLIYTYGRINKTLEEESDDTVERKLQYCNGLLQIYNIISPGLSKERGLTLFELNSVKMLLAKKSFVSDRTKCAQGLKECIDLLKETGMCLKHESQGSFEHLVYQASARQLWECKGLLEMVLLLPGGTKVTCK